MTYMSDNTVLPAGINDRRVRAQPYEGDDPQDSAYVGSFTSGVYHPLHWIAFDDTSYSIWV
jgi:hypothetical protein